MFKAIAAFEAKYHLRSPLAAVSALLFFLLAFGATTVDQITIGSSANVHVNSPSALVQVVGLLNVFGLFVITAFVASAVIRDDETGFAPIVRATRLTKGPYLAGRFAGAFAVAFTVMLAVPLGVLLGSFMPWVDAEKLGPFVASHYLYAIFIVGLPTLLVMAAAFFAVATVTRSMLWTYVTLVAVLVLFLVTRVLLRDPVHDTLAALSDPFGMSPLMRATRYWTAAERNTLLPPLEGLLLANRLIWLGVAAALFALAWVRFRFDAQGLKGRRLRRAPAAPPPAAAPAPHAPPILTALPAARGGMGWGQLAALTRFDMGAVFKSPAFFVILALGLFNAWGALSGVAEVRGVRSLPVTRAVIQALEGGFTIIPIIIAMFYAGELVWRDRQQRMHELVDAAPVPTWAHLVPKLLALTGVLAATYVAAALFGMAFQLLHGYTVLEPTHYLLWFILPGLVQALLMAALALALQVIAPSKPIGWGLTLLVMLSSMALELAGWEHPLYSYGSAPSVPLSDMNGMGRFWVGRAWLHGYWLAFAGMLLVLAYGLWRRGTQDALKPRIAQLGQRLAGVPMLLLGGLATAWVGLGVWAFYNTNVLNTYQNSTQQERELADMEKALIGYDKQPQPTITHVALNVRLYPREVRAATQGQYTLENRSGAPLTAVHVAWAEPLQMQRLDLEGATLERDYTDYNYRIYRLATPMQPGERRTLRFDTLLAQRGFTAAPTLTELAANGTFLNNMAISPILGFSRAGLLQDRAKRRKHGLEPALRMPPLEDEAARAHHYLRHDSDWVTAELSVETDADQTPVAPGVTVSDTVQGGRRLLRTRTEAPIQHFFSIQSARYAEGKATWMNPAGQPVALTVYHHPAHAQNVPRMLKAMEASLALYSRIYSPYQFQQARVIEFPAYANFAQAFAATMPYSEGIGFIQNAREEGDIDLVTYVTAHEFAHQWWAHQIIGGDMQGSTLLSETFAQYSALRVMEQLHGPAMMRQFLKYELDSYLRARGSEVIEELPLSRVENQPYIHYRKGSLAMWTAKELLGADVVDTALRSLLAEFAFKPAPYPTSAHFISHLRDAAGRSNAQRQQLITDLFDKITLVDMKAENARATQRPDGRWDVRFAITGRKLYADGKGVETEAPLNEPFDVGVFTAEPGKPGFTAANVLHSERRWLRSGKTDITLTVTARPTHVGVDAQNTRIDRNASDNVARVE